MKKLILTAFLLILWSTTYADFTLNTAHENSVWTIISKQELSTTLWDTLTTSNLYGSELGFTFNSGTSKSTNLYVLYFNQNLTWWLVVPYWDFNEIFFSGWLYHELQNCSWFGSKYIIHEIKLWTGNAVEKAAIDFYAYCKRWFEGWVYWSLRINSDKPNSCQNGNCSWVKQAIGIIKWEEDYMTNIDLPFYVWRYTQDLTNEQFDKNIQLVNNLQNKKITEFKKKYPQFMKICRAQKIVWPSWEFDPSVCWSKLTPVLERTQKDINKKTEKLQARLNEIYSDYQSLTRSQQIQDWYDEWIKRYYMQYIKQRDFLKKSKKLTYEKDIELSSAIIYYEIYFTASDVYYQFNPKNNYKQQDLFY